MHPTLPLLDSSLYPLKWAESHFQTPEQLLSAVVQNEAHPDKEAFWQLLYADKVYQQWINFTVFGRYIQRSFAAFAAQSEDNFNVDMPELLKRELVRHAQLLPLGQVLFFGGEMPLKARQEKLLTTTLSPIGAWQTSQTTKHGKAVQVPVVNVLQVSGQGVKAFAVPHNKCTSERLRSEVMLLDFSELRLVKEEEMMRADRACCVRYYYLS